MVRLSVFVTAVVGALLAAMARVAPAAAVNTTPDRMYPRTDLARGQHTDVIAVCNPAVCMGLTLIYSTCVKDIDIGSLTPEGLLGATTEVTQCVCADPKAKKLSRYH